MAHHMSYIVLLVNSIKEMSHWTCGIDSYIFTAVESFLGWNLGKLLIVLARNVQLSGINPWFRRIFRLVIDIGIETRAGRISERRKVVTFIISLLSS